MKRYDPYIDSSESFQGMQSVPDGDYVEYEEAKALVVMLTEWARDLIAKLTLERDQARKDAEWARDLIDGMSEASTTKFDWEQK